MPSPRSSPAPTGFTTPGALTIAQPLVEAITNVLIGSVGSFTVSGGTGLFAFTWPDNFKQFTLTGFTATFSIKYTLAASVGSFGVTGNKALFSFSWPGNFGSFTETGGKDKYAITWPGAFGHFSLTGFAASLTYTPPANVRMEWPRRYREMLASRGRGI